MKRFFLSKIKLVRVTPSKAKLASNNQNNCYDDKSSCMPVPTAQHETTFKF